VEKRREILLGVSLPLQWSGEIRNILPGGYCTHAVEGSKISEVVRGWFFLFTAGQYLQ